MTARLLSVVMAICLSACPRSEPSGPTAGDGSAEDEDPAPRGTRRYEGSEIRHGGHVFRVGTRVRLHKRAGSIPPSAPYNSAKTLLGIGPGQVGTVTRLLVLDREGPGSGNPVLEVRWDRQPWPEWEAPTETADAGESHIKRHVLEEWTTTSMHPSYVEPLPPG